LSRVFLSKIQLFIFYKKKERSTSIFHIFTEVKLLSNSYNMTKNLLFIILFSTISILSNAQEKDTTNNNKVADALKSVTPYGTFEYAFGGNKLGMAVVEIIPRIGVKGKWYFDESDKYYFFTTAEVGLHLVNRNDYIAISSDPGEQYSKVNQTFYARQGYIGIGTPYGRISLGKQWGVHYTLAGNVDNMYMFGGFAIGVYNAGTDGGPSGTGRADQALKYELEKGNYYIGLQGQFRDVSSNNSHFADAVSAATSYKIGNIKIGVSYAKVFDGVDSVTHGEAKINDEMIAAFFGFDKNNVHFAVIGQFFNNHEYTDLKRFYKGYGIEYNLKINFGKQKRWSFVNNIAYMVPFKSEGLNYISNWYAFEIARRFSLNTVLFAGFKLDAGTLSDGSHDRMHTIAGGFYYNFNYPVP